MSAEQPVTGPACTSDHCITCGDIAVEVRVVRLLPDGLADVDTGAGTERVSVALVSADVGDMILVHAGEALAVVGR
jgi:hydrogenase expression/formation protein HypC